MADLQISKKKISDLFTGMQGKKFIIPDYQRPYSWTTEECETLWEDVSSFCESSDKDNEYFLGSIVSFKNIDGNDEIIDGQQRITSILLLLRAFYKKLENMPSDDKRVIGLKNQIEPCIWDVDDISSEIKDYSEIRLRSEVASDEEIKNLHKILETGNSDENQKDKYSINYNFFLDKCNQYAERNPMQWYELCVTFLKRCIVLPVECSDLDSALTIFSTLNDRGKPLDDADIFKAQIYRNYKTNESKNTFIQQWKEIGELCELAKITINDIFRYYAHIIRARKGDISKEIGLRTFYSQEKFNAFKQDDFLPELILLAKFWRQVNNGLRDGDEEIITLSYESKKYLHIMKRYPNDYWKYVVSVFFIKHYKSNDFDTLFIAFIKKLTAYYYAKFIKHPTVNQIKADTFTFCKSIISGETLSFIKIYTNDDDFIKDINQVSWKVGTGLLLLKAYLNPNQKQEIEDGFEVEHIFPKKWQDTNYFGWTKEEADEYLDTFGNMVILEKKLNIQAGNGYFLQKKGKYQVSKIQEVKLLANYPKTDWLKEDIEKRQKEFEQSIVSFFNENLA